MLIKNVLFHRCVTLMTLLRCVFQGLFWSLVIVEWHHCNETFTEWYDLLLLLWYCSVRATKILMIYVAIEIELLVFASSLVTFIDHRF